MSYTTRQAGGLSGIIDLIFSHPAIEIPYLRFQQYIPVAPGFFSGSIPEKYIEAIRISESFLTEKEKGRNTRYLEYLMSKLIPYKLEITPDYTKTNRGMLHFRYQECDKQEPIEFTYTPQEGKTPAKVIITSASEKGERHLNKILGYTGITCTTPSHQHI